MPEPLRSWTMPTGCAYRVFDGGPVYLVFTRETANRDDEWCLEGFCSTLAELDQLQETVTKEYDDDLHDVPWCLRRNVLWGVHYSTIETTPELVANLQYVAMNSVSPQTAKWIREAPVEVLRQTREKLQPVTLQRVKREGEANGSE